jgi:hypothetical protein
MGLFTGENALLEKVERHDRFQFEVKLDYPLDPDADSQAYTVETYFFLAGSLNVNEYTYGAADFYADVRDQVRFKTPQMTLGQLVGTSPLSPLTRLDEGVLRIRSAAWTPEDLRVLLYESKMLGCILRAALRDLGNLVVQTLGHGTVMDHGDAERLVDESLPALCTVLSRFRDVGTALLIPGFPSETLSSLRLVDEYLSLTAESYAMHLLDSMPDAGANLRTRVAHLALDEVAYRTRRGYRSVARLDSNNEDFVYRNSLLKKFVGSIQYLQIHRADTRASAEHAAFAVAAGIAMAFATAVSFLAITLAPLSWTLFAVLVVSYMLKDRIKEFVRSLFNRWLGKTVPDHKIVITDPSTGARIGQFRRKFMVLPIAEVPPDVRRVRDAGRTEFLAEREFSESVFRYTKVLKLRPRRIFGSHRRVAALTDVLRMNVRHFLHSMDEPRPVIQILDPDTHLPTQVPAMRTYHLNAVLRFWRGDDPARAAYRKLRVVLDQDGIHRVETFDPDGPPRVEGA